MILIFLNLSINGSEMDNISSFSGDVFRNTNCQPTAAKPNQIVNIKGTIVHHLLSKQNGQ